MMHSRKAFTLIEFLVVLLILLLIAAILFPVFNQARKKAKGPVKEPLATGRAYLVGSARERLGYGLYSYILFKKRPKAGTTLEQRYLSIIDAYIDYVPAVATVEKSVARAHINITYLPVNREVPSGSKAEDVLKLYDFERSQVLLQQMPRLRGDGPFIVSFRQPLTLQTGEKEPRLRMDLSAVDPRIISAWMDLFLREAARERFSGPDSGRRFVLRLRNSLAQAAQGLDTARRGALWWKNTVAALVAWDKPAL